MRNVIVLLALGMASAAVAQDGAASAVTAQAAAAPDCQCVEIPALTPVVIELLSPVGSKISQTGERFPIALHEAIVINGKEVIAAGARGEGEIIHAKKAGGSGAAGELVLAARYVTVGDRQLKLRSMKMGLTGRDAMGTVNALNAASAISPLPIGLVGYFITGREVEMPAGTIAAAKTAEAFALPSSAHQGTSN